MKQVLSALLLTGLLAVPVTGLAAFEQPTDEPTPEELVGSAGDLIDLIETIGNWIFAAVLSLAGVFLFISGFMFVTAGGNPEKVNTARQWLVNALIGVAVALGAYGLVAVVKTILGYTGS